MDSALELAGQKVLRSSGKDLVKGMEMGLKEGKGQDSKKGSCWEGGNWSLGGPGKMRSKKGLLR